MKTLIFNGSPRVHGDTVSLIEKLTESLPGEVMIVDAYRCDVAACVDCRYCWKHEGCAIKDDMQDIYEYIQVCDNIVIASPIYFSELTGKLLDVGSRLQTYFSAKVFRKETPIAKAKKGAVILVGGGDGNFDKAYDTACTLLHHIKCEEIHPLVSAHNTDQVSAIEEATCVTGVASIGRFFMGVK